MIKPQGLWSRLGALFRYLSLEATGVFKGTGTKSLGVYGAAVTLAAFLNLAKQRSPDGRRMLGRRRPFPGWHLLAIAPQSFDIYPLLYPESEYDFAMADREALEALILGIEDHCAWARRGAGGRRIERARGLIVPAWRHGSSRLLLLAPHWHLIVLNSVECFDGRWVALPGIRSTRKALATNRLFGSGYRNPLFARQKALGSLYRQALREALERRGYRTRDRADFGFELDGVSDDLLRHFGKRRAEVLAMRKTLRPRHAGVHEQELLDWAARSSRQAKPKHIDLPRLRETWRAEALEIEGRARDTDIHHDQGR